MIRAAWVSLLLVALVACGTTSAGSVHQVGQISLTVSGGITGWERKLVVDAGGTAHLTVVRGPSPARTSYVVPAATLQQLRAKISDPAFQQLHAEYPAPSGSADVQVYVLSAEVDGRSLSTTTYDAADAPQILEDVLALLGAVLNAFGSSAATCTAGYSSAAPAVHLTYAESGSSRSVPLCASIWVVLLATREGVQWQSIQSSDTSILEIVPLPLPAPPPGGTRAVFLAKRAGSATLFAGSRDSSCPPNAFCLMIPAWSVTITVG